MMKTKKQKPSLFKTRVQKRCPNIETKAATKPYELSHGHGGAWKTAKVKRDRSWVPDETFRLSASDRDHYRLWSDNNILATQGAVFHCISGRDYKRLACYLRWKHKTRPLVFTTENNSVRANGIAVSLVSRQFRLLSRYSFYVGKYLLFMATDCDDCRSIPFVEVTCSDFRPRRSSNVSGKWDEWRT